MLNLYSSKFRYEKMLCIGTCEIRLECKTALRGSSTLKSFVNGSAITITKYVIFQVINGTLVASVHLPAAGAYCLQLFGADASEDVETFTFLWSYFILSKSQSPMASMLESHEDCTYGPAKTAIIKEIRSNVSDNVICTENGTYLYVRIQYFNRICNVSHFHSYCFNTFQI